MGFISSIADQFPTSLVTLWVFFVELIPHREAVFAELEATKASFNSLVSQFIEIASSRVVLAVFFVIAAYKIYGWLFNPLSILRLNHEVGYLADNRQSLHDRAADVRRRRKTGDLPPVYPNGWFRVLDSRDLSAGEVKQVCVLGLELAVYRTESGSAAILDAYCPHLGANLAAGGTVEGDNLHCPFHGWQFSKEGVCVKIPYCSQPIPSSSSLKSHPCLETNGQILVWFDAEGRSPFWYPPAVNEINNGKWRYCGTTLHTLNCHIEEIPENAADVPHLEYLHGPFIATGSDLRKTHSSWRFIHHVWTASWAPLTEQGKTHLSVLNLLHQAFVFGIRFPPLDLKVTATQIGPGLVYLTWSSMLGDGCFVQSLSPIEPLLQSLHHNVYAAWTVPTFVAKFFLLGELIQVERDVMVWNNKMYRGNPVLCKGDTLIKKHRAWYSQFYSEHSPTYDEIMSKSLSW